MEGSSIADAAVSSGHGYCDNISSRYVSDNRFLLPLLLRGVAVLNLVVLYSDDTARSYRVADFKEPLERALVLKDLEALGTFQMNDLWVLTLKSLAAKYKQLETGEILVKGKRCVILDSNCSEIRI